MAALIETALRQDEPAVRELIRRFTPRLFRARRRLRTALESRLKGGFDSIFPFNGARCVNMADRVIDHLRRATQI